MILGIVKDVTDPINIKIQAKEPLPLGKYVTIERDDDKCLGLVETSLSSSSAISNITNFQEALESVEVSKDSTRDKGFETTIRIIGTVESLKNGRPTLPSTPTIPGTKISDIEHDILRIIFSPDSSEWSRIGNLLRTDEIDAKINIDEIVSRHLAILSMTGMGKSNFVTVLAREIGKRNGTAIIFDYHNDYGQLELFNEENEKINVNHVDAKITPRILSGDQFAQIIDIPKSAIHQADILIEIFEQIREETNFWERLEAELILVRDGIGAVAPAAAPGPAAAAEQRDRQRRAGRLLTRVQRARRLYSNVIDPLIENPRDSLRQNSINILNATNFNEKQADIGLSYYLETAFNDRKNSALGNRDVIFQDPLFFVIEEAHTFIKVGSETETKFIAGKIAKEARKFGMGLCIVSQRPSKVDEDVLSQMGSFAVLKMIQKRDQDSIFNTSEEITEKMAGHLSSLNVGEAFLTGRFVKIPTLVKIDEETKSKGFGSDISATNAWSKSVKMTKKESSQELIDKEDL
ncbi:MAG: ATP-binding protein [Candidatus Nitrosopelagicus sp.]|nr:ATP-binding protein [Candidatus Nitrosopelagicus sp.]